MKIYPVKTNKKDEFNVPIECHPNHSFLGLTIGGVRSGKTNLLINLIYQGYINAFDQIYFFSPNVHNDDIFQNNVAIDDNIIKFDQDFENIDLYVSSIVDSQKEIDKEDRKPILIILDDILGFIKDRSFISNFCSRYRQLKISLLFSIQNFRKLPPSIRTNASWIIFFKTYNQKELEKIEEELAHIPDFLHHWNTATDEKYSFLFCDLKNLKLYKKFDTLLYSKD